MTTTTTLARNYKLGRDYQADGWYGYINNGEYTSEQQSTLVEALMDAMETEVNNLLPDGCSWCPATSEITGPVTATLDGIDLDELLETASRKVASQFEQIEADTLGVTL